MWCCYGMTQISEFWSNVLPPSSAIGRSWTNASSRTYWLLKIYAVCNTLLPNFWIWLPNEDTVSYFKRMESLAYTGVQTSKLENYFIAGEDVFIYYMFHVVKWLLGHPQAAVPRVGMAWQKICLLCYSRIHLDLAILISMFSILFWRFRCSYDSLPVTFWYVLIHGSFVLWVVHCHLRFLFFSICIKNSPCRVVCRFQSNVCIHMAFYI